MRSIRHLATLISTFRIDAVTTIVFLSFSILLSASFSLFTGLAIDDATHGDFPGAMRSGCFLLMATLLGVCSWFVSSEAQLALISKLKLSMRDDLFQKASKTEASALLQLEDARLRSSVDSDVSDVINAIQDNLFPVVWAILSIVIVVSIAMKTEWRLASVLVALLVPLVFLHQQVNRLSLESANEVSLERDRFSNAIEAFLSVKALLRSNAFGVFAADRKSFASSAKAYVEAESRIARRTAKLTFGTVVANAFATFTLLELGIYLAAHHQASIGTVIAFLGFQQMATLPLMQLTKMPAHLAAIAAASVRLHQIMELPISEGSEIATECAVIKLQDVFFAYAPELDVLRDINLTISRGEKVAIIGESGSGKSTLALMLAGILTPSSGVASYNGTRYGEFEIASLRKHLLYESGDLPFIPGTLRENLMYGSPTIRQVDFTSITAEIANFAIERVTFEKNVVDLEWSSGQYRRLLVARALMAHPIALISDEPTRGLDAETEIAVHKCLLQRVGTVIVVTHAMRSLPLYDRILELTDGRITRDTTPGEFLKTHQGDELEIVSRPLSSL